MKAETKDIGYYDALPYTITIRKDDEGDFVSRIAELPGCIAHGDSPSSALENLRVVQRLWVEEALSAGNQTIPEPEDDSALPSGKWLQRVPRRLHKGLVDLARRDNVSLNQLVTAMLSEAITVRSCAHAFEAILAHAPHRTPPTLDTIGGLWWRFEDRPHGELVDWSMPHERSANLTRSLSLAGTIKQSFEEPNEHTESHKQLATK